MLPLSQATVSQHLKELKNCGLIKAAVKGTSNLYSLDKMMLKEFESEFKKMIKSVLSKK
jgi:ArsR family transcriptional regulator